MMCCVAFLCIAEAHTSQTSSALNSSWMVDFFSLATSDVKNKFQVCPYTCQPSFQILHFLSGFEVHWIYCQPCINQHCESITDKTKHYSYCKRAMRSWYIALSWLHCQFRKHFKIYQFYSCHLFFELEYRRLFHIIPGLAYNFFCVTRRYRSDVRYWLSDCLHWLDWCDPGEWWYL